MNSTPSAPTLRRWPQLRLRWVLLALALFLANALWRAMTVNLDLRASGFHTTFWKPMVWELTSALVVWALLPLIQTVVLNSPWKAERWVRFLGFHLLRDFLSHCLTKRIRLEP